MSCQRVATRQVHATYGAYKAEEACLSFPQENTEVTSLRCRIGPWLLEIRDTLKGTHFALRYLPSPISPKETVSQGTGFILVASCGYKPLVDV